MSLFKSSMLFSLGTILSRLSGLIRESILAGVFGANVFFDAFLVAYRIPNLLRDMLAEGALSGAFTRVYTATYESSPRTAAELYFDCLRVFLVLGSLIVLTGMILSPELVKLMTMLGNYGDSTDFYTNATALTRLMFPFILFPILGSLAMGVLHRHNGFFITGVSPILLNLGFILGATLLASKQGWGENFFPGEEINDQIVGLGVGVLLGGAAQFLFQFIFSLKKLKEKISFSGTFLSSHTKKVFVLMTPAAIAASAGPITAFVNTNFATGVGEGAVSWLYFSFRLIQLPVGVFGVAIGMAALPALTRSITQAQGKVDQNGSQKLQNCLEMVIWLMVPASLLLYTSADDFVVLLFKHARFDAEDALSTAAALRAYSLGVVGYGLIKVLTSFYFAVERTRYAMFVSLFGIMNTIAVNYLLVERYGHVGLAYAAAATLSLNSVLLFVGTRVNQISWSTTRWFRLVVGVMIATTIYLLVVTFGVGQIKLNIFEVEKLNAILKLSVNFAFLTAFFGAALFLVERKTPIQFIKMK